MIKILLVFAFAGLSTSLFAIDNLFEAIRDNDLKKFKLLVEADPGIVNKEIEYRTYPFLEAASVCRVKMMEFIIEKGGDPKVKSQKHGDNALHIIAARSSLTNEGSLKTFMAVVDLLKANGLDFNEKNKYGESPLYLACKSDQREANVVHAAKFLKAFIENGAKFEKNDGLLNYNLGKTIKPGADLGNLSFTKEIINLGADVNSMDKVTNATPLIVFLANKTIPDEAKVELVKLLIEKGAKVNVKDKSNRKPLSMVDKSSPLYDILRKTKSNK
ncbi:MAG TPA: hypothetical protein DET40_07220 [Lentisphaeria bacterium]|nr:MAG: hypothetical protein A2X45_07080 [Lentisphaerae bacterium GWF2_50_93]HCE43322.1 hypothetical protein [Lentisphaeria bacterium]